MNAELKQHVTKGKVRVTKYSNPKLRNRSIIRSEESTQIVCTIPMLSPADFNRQDADAELIAEAFTVFSETGMTPREMQDTFRKVRIQLQLIMHGTAEGSDVGAHENAYGLAADALKIIGL